MITSETKGMQGLPGGRSNVVDELTLTAPSRASVVVRSIGPGRQAPAHGIALRAGARRHRRLAAASILAVVVGTLAPLYAATAFPPDDATPTLPGAGATHLRLPLSVTDARHLLERTGFGAPPSRIAALLGRSRAEAIDALLEGIRTDPTVPMPEWTRGPPPRIWRTWYMPPERYRHERRARRREIDELRMWWVREMVETPSPLTERLVLFWHNHFVSTFEGTDGWSHSLAAQNAMFRRLGAGDFPTLVRAVIRDPAMLNFLDNESNVASHPNENFARELLELFTLGEGAYDEATVKEVSRVLTGWTVDRFRGGKFVVRDDVRDKGRKTLFGHRGRFDADELVDLLMARPELPRFIAAKFWREFVSSVDEDPGAIDRAAAAFRASGLQIKALLKAILESEAFWAPQNRGRVVKSPVDFVIGTIRTTGVVPRRWRRLPDLLARLGQDLFGQPSVAGWPGGLAWVTHSRLAERQAVLKALLEPIAPADRSPPPRPRPAARQPAQVVAEDRLVARDLVVLAASRPSDGSGWQTLTFGFESLRFDDRSWSSFGFSIVIAPDGSYGIRFRESLCEPGCFVAWPTRHGSSAREFLISLDGRSPEWQWLSPADRNLVSAILRASPIARERLHGAPAIGRAADVRAWSRVLEEVEDSLAHAAWLPRARRDARPLRFFDTATEDASMEASARPSDLVPPLPNGVPARVGLSDWPRRLPRPLDSAKISDVLLSLPPVSVDGRSRDLSALLHDPVYHLK